MRLINLLLIIFLLSGCIPQTQITKSISAVCIQSCKDAIGANKDLSPGPCLLDPMPQNNDWVCDVAHNPRQSVDNKPQNQCQTYNTIAHHFVEVTPKCKFIRQV